ncbi:MAG: DMT family transporter [Clostridiales bacterium]
MITSTPLTEKRSIGYLATGMGAIILGTEAILAQLCYAGGFTIITILTVRYWLAAVIFFAIAIIYKKPLIIPLQYRKIVLLMAGLTILGITLFFMALTKLPAALAILFLYAYPSMTAIISRVFLHRKFTPAVMASLLCSACGLLLLSWSSFATISIIGMLLALGAALEQAIKLNIMEKVLPHLDLVTYNFTVMLIAALLCSLAAPFSGSFSLQVTPTAWIYAIFLSIAVTALSNFLMT